MGKNMKMPVKKWALKIARFFAVVFFILAAAEILTRAFLYISLNNYFNKHIPAAYRENMKNIHLAHIMESSWCRFDPLCYYIPYNGFFRGARGQFDIPLKKDEREIRILCLGDSTTFGDAVSYNNCWPAILNRLLKNTYPGMDITVLNAGIPGASSRQIKRIFQVYLVKYNPDIVIWRKGAILSDRYEINEISSRARLILWRCLYESRLLRTICLLIDKDKDWKWTTANAIYDFVTARRGSLKSDGQYKVDFDIVKKIANENGISRVFAVDYIQRTKDDTIFGDYIEYKDWGTGPVLNTIEAFKEKLKYTSVNNIFVDSCHMTEIGTSIIAEKVYDYLLEKKWIGEWNNNYQDPVEIGRIFPSDNN